MPLSSLWEIYCCMLTFLFRFEAFPCVHRAKGPNREQQALSSSIEKELSSRHVCLHTTDQSRAQDSANYYLRDRLVTHAVICATVGFNLQCNNVARQLEGKCCPYYRTFIEVKFYASFFLTLLVETTLWL